MSESLRKPAFYLSTFNNTPELFLGAECISVANMYFLDGCTKLHNSIAAEAEQKSWRNQRNCLATTTTDRGHEEDKQQRGLCLRKIYNYFMIRRKVEKSNQSEDFLCYARVCVLWRLWMKICVCVFILLVICSE